MPSTWHWPSLRVAISFLAMAGWCGILTLFLEALSKSNAGEWAEFPEQARAGTLERHEVPR
jgi:hypothetical protein